MGFQPCCVVAWEDWCVRPSQVYKLPPENLYATYFGGDESQGLEPDIEARDIWLTVLPASRVLPFGCKVRLVPEFCLSDARCAILQSAAFRRQGAVCRSKVQFAGARYTTQEQGTVRKSKVQFAGARFSTQEQGTRS